MLAILVTLALFVPSAEEPNWIELFLEGSRALEQGELEVAEHALERALELQPRHAPTAWQLAGVSARTGDTGGALDWLEAAAEWGGGEAALLAWDPDLASLRNEARFHSLLQRLGDREATQPAPKPLVAELVGNHGGSRHAASPRAEVVASGGYGHTVLYDLRAGEVLAVLDRPGEDPYDFAISPDGRWVVASGSKGRRYDSPAFVRVFDARTGDFVRELNPAGWPAWLEFSRNGNRLLALYNRQSGGPVWETDDWTQVGRVGTGRRPVLFSPDGRQALFVSPQEGDRCDVVWWDVDERKRVRKHEDLRSPDIRLDSTPDGGLVLAQGDRVVHVYDSHDGEELCRIESGGAPFRAARFLGATGELVTLDEDQRLRVWDANTGGELRSFVIPREDSEYRRLDCAPDGSRVLMTGQGWWGEVPQVFDGNTGELLWTAEGRIRGARHSPDGSRVLVEHVGGTCKVHEARSGEVLATLGDSRSRTIVRAHPRREELWVGREDGRLLRIDAAHGRALDRWHHGSAKILDLCLTKDGELLATIDGEGVLRVIEWPTGQVVVEIPDADLGGRGQRAPVLEFAADGSALLIGGFGARFRIFDMASGTARAELEVENPRGSWAWSADGLLLAIAAAGGHVILFDTLTGERLPTQLEIEAQVSALTFEPRTGRLWVGDDRDGVHVFDLESGTEVQALSTAGLDPFSWLELGGIVFRDDGQQVAITSIGWGVISLWDPRSGERLWHYDYGGGDDSAVLRCVFGRGGERVYVWGRVWSPRVLDAENGQTLLSLGRRFDDPLPLPDERLLATSDPEGLEVIETEGGERRWARLELSGDNWLLTSPTRHVDGTREALEQLHLVLPEHSYPLDALAAALVDPKRVRAAAEGVALRPAQLPAMPVLHWDEAPPRIVRLDNGEEPPTVTLVAKCTDGVAGFELLRKGEPSRVEGTALSRSERRWTLPLDRPAPGGSINYRWRAISTTGIRSRALHLTVETDPN